MSQAREIDEAAAVEAAAVRLLAMREHSRQEIRRKLAARFNEQGLIEEVLDDLERRRYLSDERFAEAYVNERSRKGYGPLRIRAELSERGIAAGLSARWLDDGAFDWAEVLTEAATRKFGAEPAADLRSLAKRGRFLEQRGFPIGLVRRYLDQVRSF